MQDINIGYIINFMRQMYFYESTSVVNITSTCICVELV
jgi:hypothetical protein